MTISLTEAEELDRETTPSSPAIPVVAPPPVPREAAENVLRYLVFHRSLIGEGEGQSALLERYMSLVQNLEEGLHVVVDDPFQKATAMLFELVMKEAFDPWEIDLVQFTRVYLERFRSEDAVDFGVAGRLLFMAWNILYLQSEEVLHHRDLSPEGIDTAEDGSLIDPSQETYLDLMETPEAVDVTSTILDGSTPSPLFEMVRHPETRPVTLLELVRALDEAEEDARKAARVQELRERLREEQRAPPEVLVHGDIPDHDVEEAWKGVSRHPVGEAFPFLELWRAAQGRSRLVSTLLATLYLAREGAVAFHQEKLMETPVLLVRQVEARTPHMEVDS
jgi:segregation and condensation protein A